MGTARATTALLVIDMFSQLDFPRAREMEPALLRSATRIRALRRTFHRHGWPVVFVNDHFARWQVGPTELVAMAIAAGGTAEEIARMLAPGPRDHFVPKPKHSAFLATSLPVLLAKLGVRRLLLTGMALESCVVATAFDAHAREFGVGVVRDAVAGLPGLRQSAFTLLSGSETATLLTSRGAARWAQHGG
jgi:nicotinamidase-related amidase